MGKREIYLQLTAAGMNHIGACALMGNWQKESNCESVRIENDFALDRSKSKTYMENVDNNRLDFIDGRGWGLAQWTYFSRKERLLAFCKSLHKSIGDETTQVSFAIKELKEDFQALWKYLQVTPDLHEATRWVCYDFENPAVKDVEERFKFAQAFDKEFSNGAVTSAPTQEELDEIAELNQSTQTAPPETNKLKGKLTNETVGVLQIICHAYGYDIGPSGPDSLIGPRIKAALSQFTHDFMEI